LQQKNFFEKTDVSFEYFKAAVFLSFALSNYPTYVKEYFEKLQFKNIGEWLHAALTISQAMHQFNAEKTFGKLCIFLPQNESDKASFDYLSINQLIGKSDVDLFHLKAFPLFRDKEQYQVIDNEYYHKRLYTGLYFDLLRRTSLKTNIKPDVYISLIAKKVLEERLFHPIFKGLAEKHYSCLTVDTGKSNDADGYYRKNKVAFLVEFKGYLMSEADQRLVDFQEIKQYIDNKFIENQDGKAKGVTQLNNAIKIMVTSGLPDDPWLIGQGKNVNLVIYPIICYTDTNFSLPGVNSYLNDALQDHLPTNLPPKWKIKPLSFIHLRLLYDLAVHGKTFADLQSACERFQGILKGRKIRLTTQPNLNNFLRLMPSFDTAYEEIIQKDIFMNGRKSEPTYRMLQLAQIDQSTLDKVL
jgi:hypothetical protein